MTNKEPSSLGVLLVQLRAAAGLTQEQLAARAGLSPDAVAALERGKRRSPRAVTVELLANALELDAPARAKLVAAARGRDISEQGRAMPGVEQDTVRPARHSWWLESEPTPLVGRAHELDAIMRLLVSEGVRLLTLTGPAGVGKTRLALAAAAADQVAARFPDGVVVVDLAPVRDPPLVLHTIARTLGITDTGSPPLIERLRAFLHERAAMLLVLDNFEQVLPAAALLADVLAGCPGLRQLVTSRVPLQLRWEQTLRVAPLPILDPTAPLPPLVELTQVPAVALFLERVRARRPDYTLTETQAPLLVELVAQLDGLPLALELAAARLDVLSLPAIVARLGDRLRLLTSKAQDRQLFRCLGVFLGCVSLNAINVVARVVAGGTEEGDGDGGRVLAQLVSLADQSLLLPVRTADLSWQQGGTEDADDEEAVPVFGMLETVREYAWERLTAEGELESARRAHAHYALALAERAEVQLRGHDQRVWYLRLECELDNLRAALRWLLDQDDPAERQAGLQLAGALWRESLWRCPIPKRHRLMPGSRSHRPRTC